MNEYKKVLRGEPGEVSQDMLSETAALNQINPDEFYQAMQQEEQAKNGVQPQNEAQQPAQQNEQQEQRKDSARRLKRRRSYKLF